MEQENKLSSRGLVEAVLFATEQPLSVKDIAEYTGVAATDVIEIVEALRIKFTDGIVLMEKGNKFMLATHPEASEAVESMSREEENKPLGAASLETLAIILYRGPVSRADLERIRGVNCQFILRSLSSRGLIEKVHNADDSRVYTYRPTFDLLRYMGAEHPEALPELATIRERIAKFEDEQEQAEEQKDTDTVSE